MLFEQEFERLQRRVFGPLHSFIWSGMTGTDQPVPADHHHRLALYGVLTVKPQSFLGASLGEVGCSEPDLDRHPKGHPHQATLAHQFRRETPMTRDGIAQRLRIGSARYVSHLLSRP